LNCTIPAFVKYKVGSFEGTRLELCTIRWSWPPKKSRKVRRISLDFVGALIGDFTGDLLGPALLRGAAARG
jgi:hypothetical protein